MQKEALQRLREPAAFVLLAAAGLQLLAGMVLLFTDSLDAGGKFTLRALSETIGGRDLIAGLAITALLVVAVLLVSWGETPARQARNVVTGALAVFGAAALFGLISTLAGLVAGGEGLEIGAGLKLAAFLYGASKLAVLGVGGWFTWTVFQSLQPARPPAPQQGYPGYGYQDQQGQPYQQYPQGGYPQQPVEGQQQQYDPQQYQQQQYQQYQQGGYQQGQPQPGYPQQGGQSLEEESAGEWTRAYGGDQPQYGQNPEQQGYGQQGYGQQGRPEEGGGEWYRDNRPQ